MKLTQEQIFQAAVTIVAAAVSHGGFNNAEKADNKLPEKAVELAERIGAAIEEPEEPKKRSPAARGAKRTTIPHP